MRRPWILLLLLAALGAGACGSSDEPEGSGTPEKTGATESSTTPTEGGCTQVDAPAAKEDGGQRKPRRPLPRGKDYEAVVKTSCGSFTIGLNPEASLNAVASFAALARGDFFDDTVFHRIVPDFVIQGGDPTGADPAVAGSGGPGYSTRDRPSSDTTYTKGVVAMAKTEAEPPGTAGSQFYVVTGADAMLPPDYAVIGAVTDGLDVVERIGLLGDAQQQPTQVVAIEDVAIRATPAG